jgi:DNA-binding transcriptional ArsR family regulator
MSNNQQYKTTEYAEIFKALSNPNRLRILLKLVSCCRPGTVSLVDERDTAYVGEVGQDLGIVKSTVSHHIKELKRVGLIRTRRAGQKIECWVDVDVLSSLRQFFTF